MNVDARFKVALGISVHAMLLCDTLRGAAAVLGVVLLAWLIVGGAIRTSVAFWVAGELVLAGIFAAAYALGSGSADYNTMAFLRWSAGFTGSVLAVLWPGIEGLARVVMVLPIPGPMAKALGFALRVVPVLTVNAAAHRRNVQMLRLLPGGGPHGRVKMLRLGVEEVLTQCVDDVDKIVTQLELRGYDSRLFGTLAPLRYSFGNLVVATACISSVVIAIVELVA